MFRAGVRPVPGGRRGTMLIIRPYVEEAYEELFTWLADGIDPSVSLTLWDDRGATRLQRAVAPRRLRIVRLGARLAAFRRYKAVIVLCADGAEAISGFTAFQVLGDLSPVHRVVGLAALLLSERIVLIAPHVVQELPGLSGLLRPERLGELLAIVAALSVACATTFIAVAAIMLEDVFARLGRRR